MPIVPSVPEVTSIDNAYIVEVRTITAGEEAAKEIILTQVPVDINKVTLDVIGGTSQQIGLDFNVVGSVLTWNGFALETALEAGDKLRIIYPL